MLNKQPSIWEGVYKSFSEIKGEAQAFDGDVWVEKQREAISKTIEQNSQKTSYISDNAKSRDYPLEAFIAGLLASKPALRIVDYGGAMGQTYLDLCAKIPDFKNKGQYVVVETKQVVAAVPAVMQSYKSLSFITDIAEVTGPVDVFHMGSVLQYIEDWQGFLSDAIEADWQPDIFVLSDLLVGDIPSFVTAQNFYEAKIPVSCINIEEFMSFWQSKGYRNVFKSYYYPGDSEEYFPREALPDSHRIKTASHFVFAKD